MAQQVPKTRVDSKTNSSGKLKHSHSLVISPNLEALLEYEEECRRWVESGGTSPTTLGNDSHETPISLPPPPRGPRTLKTGPKSPIAATATKQTRGPPLSRSSSELNPFINPAPTLQDLLISQHAASGSEGGAANDYVVSSQEVTPGVKGAGLDTFSRQPSFTGKEIGNSTGSRSQQVDVLDTRRSQQPSLRKLPPLPWALNAKISTPEAVDQARGGRSELQSSQTDGSGPSHHRRMKTVPDARESHLETFLDMGEEKPKHGGLRVTLSSHGRRHPLRRRTGTGSGSPSSSSVDTMFNFLNLSTSAAADRQSFIDFVPSARPQSATNKPKDDTKSSKPLLPKPIFDHSTPFIYRRKRGESPSHREVREASLPPTSNTLHTDERAELIKKSRKLAQVFGQTPEAGTLLHAASDLHQATPHTAPPSRWGRRYSLPLTVRTGDTEVPALSSPVSFIDLSDGDDSLSAITAAPKGGRRRRSIASLSPSENITPEQQAEEERRQKREKLARLHRFLGSRVPPSLAFGVDYPPEKMFSALNGDEPQRKTWLRRRRSSSAAEAQSRWSDNTDRIKADLCSREKAINVKRAQKMEKVFGVAPPQTLYHTRGIPSPLSPSIVNISSVMAGTDKNPKMTTSSKHLARKESRPSSSESRQRLLPRESDVTEDPTAKSGRRSQVYTHYEHSLNSLHDILDRDDRTSLAELHHYLNGDDHSPTFLPQVSPTPTRDLHASPSSSPKSERRHSLPARTSLISTSSETSITVPKPDLSDFQLRRRRAAKLTNFFGVDYRELINDVLESIESGLEHERKRGTLGAEEAEDLLQRLRQLKIKRKNIH